MRIINLDEINFWLNENGLLKSDIKLSSLGYSKIASYNIPIDSGKKTALAKVIANFFENDRETLLWINEFGIWPSCEDWNLFKGFRKSLGETSLLFEKPGHLFSKDDIDSVVSLLSMVFYFYWGAALISASKKYSIIISHDEFISFFAMEKDNLKQELCVIEKICKTMRD